MTITTASFAQSSSLQRLGRYCCLPACFLQLYTVRYESATGPLLAIEPAEVGVPLAVQKQTYRGNTLASSTGGNTALPSCLHWLWSCLAPGLRACAAEGACGRLSHMLQLCRRQQTVLPLQLCRPAWPGSTVYTPVPPLTQLYCRHCTAPAVVSSRMAWENIFMSEVVRSCPEMCR